MLRVGLITFATCSLLTAAASGQTLPRKPLPKEPLEKYDNPPACITGASDLAWLSLAIRSVHELSSQR